MSTTEDRQETQVYEVGYLVLPSIPEDKLSETVESIKNVINKAGAKELDGEDPILRKLAYSMSKTVGASRYVVENAYIGWMKFEAESGQIEGIKAGLDGITEILRYLLVKAPRESVFTFAKARELMEAEEEALNAPEVVDPLDANVSVVE